MDKKSIDNEVLLENVDMIFETLKKVDSRLETIQNKIIYLNKVYMKIELNKSFRRQQNNSYLRLQIVLINNEKMYLKKIKKALIDKFYHDIFTISDSTLMILSSLENLEIEHSEEKKTILKQASLIKKPAVVDSVHLINLLNQTILNLGLISQFIDLFKLYNDETYEKNIRENNHCNNILITLNNKRNHIILEYNKYCDELNQLVNYLMSLTVSIDKQLDNQKILDFLIISKETKII